MATQDVEILAKNISKDGDLIHAKEEVVLYSQKYILSSDSGTYNIISKDVSLVGNVTFFEGTDFVSHASKLEMNLENDSGNMQPFFVFNPTTSMWMKCEDGNFNAQSYLAKKAITSTCEVQDPDWKIGFQTGEYNKQTKFMQLYNTLFYIKDVPVFYLPYFAYSMDKSRRTGLLRPEFGYGKDEGFYYLQPLFIAPAKNWDLEFDPQIRTLRGYGLDATMRFVDSPYSQGKFSLGEFKEYSSYALENKLKNEKHRGYSLYYDRNNIFSDTKEAQSEDGLLFDFQYLNDIDYLNTLKGESISYDKLVTSRANYFYKRDKDYFGAYAKYYIDTDKVNNKDTLQELPTLQYHRFTDNLFADNIYYSLDYKTTNYTRNEGSTAFQNELNIPVGIHFPLFKEYLNFSFSENFYLTRVNYGNASLSHNFGQYSKNTHIFSLYSDLAKAYPDFFHTIYLGANYTLPGYSNSKGYFETFIPTSDDKENLSLNLVQFFYNSAGEKKVSHVLRQVIYLSDYDYKYGDLENTLKLYLSSNVNITTILNYSHQYAKTTKLQTVITYKNEQYDASLIYTHENEKEIEKTNFISLDFKTNYVKNYNLFSGADYDIQNAFFKAWKIGWKFDRKCWDYSIIYREDRTPKLTGAGSDVVKRKGIYLTFNLAQIGAVNYDFIKESGVQ